MTFAYNDVHYGNVNTDDDTFSFDESGIVNIHTVTKKYLIENIREAIERIHKVSEESKKIFSSEIKRIETEPAVPSLNI